MPDKVELSVIIVNYNGAAYIPECLESVLKSEDVSFEVIVVDNASPDNSLSVLERYLDRVKLIASPVNGGFSAGNNIGIDASSGDYVCLLNNDTVVNPDTLATLLNYLKQNSSVGAVGPKLLNADGSPQYTGSILGHWQYKTGKARKVGFLSGAAFMTRRSLLDQIGGLDENYFFYNEDLDLCKTILKAGYTLVYLPTAELIHFGGVATATRKAASIIEGYRGGLYFCSKHYPKAIFRLYQFILGLYFLIRLAIYFPLSVFSDHYQDLFRAYLTCWRILLKNDLTLKKAKQKTVAAKDR